MKGKKVSKQVKEGIMSLLTRKLYGLSINEIADSLSVSRITASKYLAVLEAEGMVHVREIGNTKLHYLPEKFREMKGGNE